MRAEEIKGLMEAYSHVYETPEVLSEEVVEEDVEVLDEQGGPESNFRQKARIRQDLAIQKAGGGAAGEEKRFQELKSKNVRPTQPGQARQRWRPQSDEALRRQAGYDVRRQGEINLKNANTKPAAPAKPAPAPDAKPAPAPAAAKPAPAPAAKPAPAPAAAKPATPAKPAPGTKAAGPESIKPKTPNPLMQKTFGYQTGNAPDQIKKASEGKPALPASTTALGSAADPKVRAALNLPSKPAASLSQKPEAPKPEAPKPQMSARAQALKAGGPAGGAREKMLNQGVDIFDLVKGHLLDEGYAETEENAVAMMANMSEEWRKSILEAYGIEILDEASYSAKAARAGKDIGKPGKMFGKIAKEAGERYGSEERGKKVAGAVLAKLRKEENENGSIELEDILALNRRMERVYEAQRARENPEDHDKEEKRKYEPVRGEKTPMPPRGDKRREEFEKWYAKQMGR